MEIAGLLFFLVQVSLQIQKKTDQEITLICRHYESNAPSVYGAALFQ